jgi:hypothetical protein
MFSLIITIISIALVAALALATIYYGGNAFNRGSAEAKASQLINEGQQINGAVTMDKADKTANVAGAIDITATTTVADLVGAKYLAQSPAGWALDGTNSLATVVSSSTDVCDKVNSKAGLATRPADLAAAKSATVMYGCFGAANAAGTVFYKF